MSARDWVVRDTSHYSDGRLMSFRAVDTTGFVNITVGDDDITCTHITHRYLDDDAEADYLHVCDLDDFITQLTALRDLRDRLRSGEKPEPCRHECVVQGPETRRECQACEEVLAA